MYFLKAIFVLLVWTLVILNVSNAANILFYHNMATYSHRVVTFPLAVALAERGHQVTFLSPFHPKEPHPNVTEIVPPTLNKFMENNVGKEFDIIRRVRKNIPPLIGRFFPMAVKACELYLESPEWNNFIKNTKHLDMVIADNCMSECGLAIAHKFKAKYVMFGTVTGYDYEHDMIGYGVESSAIPGHESDPPRTPMTFMQRVSNVILDLRWRYEHYKYMTQLDQLIRTKMGMEDMPFLDDLAGNVSLVLYTGDVLSDYVRVQPPLFVNVAGIHCKTKVDPLPNQLEEFINAKTVDGKESDGFVYISLGSMVVSSNLPQEVKQVFFDTIKSFPNLKFLWKWNGEFPKDIPENLYLSKWFPQPDLLGHPKIQAFVTQTGRPSMLEALLNGVPMISFPVIADQDGNAIRLNEIGANVILELGTVTRKELSDAISKTAYDPEMKERMKTIQKIFTDRPMSPVDTAVWWTEYVLRHHDTSHLRASGYEQTWYERRLIDVWAFLFCIALVCFSAVFYAGKMFIFTFVLTPPIKLDKIKFD